MQRFAAPTFFDFIGNCSVLLVLLNEVHRAIKLVSAAEINPPAGTGASFSESHQRKMVLLLCGLAAIHVFIFSAAFPFFNNADEPSHFDLVSQYAQGHFPRSLEETSAASMDCFATYGSPEFLMSPNTFSHDRFPAPSWRQPKDSADAAPLIKTGPTPPEETTQGDMLWTLLKEKKTWLNSETSQPPLYYALAGLWWHVGHACGFTGGRLLYWIRFLNILFVVALVWVGYVVARLVFPDRPFFWLGVPALLAFFPQTAFYSIQNDVLSPLCFGLVFVCLARWWRAEKPGVALGVATGLALAATYLTKLSNLPLLAVAMAMLLLKLRHWTRAGNLRPAVPALVWLAFCAGLPIGAWLWWSKYAFGDFTGSAAKIHFLGWTCKPFGDWWHHPIFTPSGLWTFLSGLLTTFWQGEFLWHGQPLDQPVVDAFYVILSAVFVGLAAASLLSRSSLATEFQRAALWLSAAGFIASIAFLAVLSIMFDFGNCVSPSRDHPYFTHGRLMLGALIPFLLLYLYGVDFLLRGTKGNRARFWTLAGMIAFMLISEITTDWTVFASQYNWFHP
jgi:hypothetical protein